MIWASVDPGRRTGIAVWEGKKLVVAMSKSFQAAKSFLKGCEFAIVEIPSFVRDDLRNVISCAVKAGELGAVCQKVKYIPASTWKGNLPKRVTRDRARKILDSHIELADTDHDAWDAVCLGLWYRRKIHD